MGASASKASRATAKSRPSWAGATAESLDASARVRLRPADDRASAIKDDFIRSDSQDPQLLANLSQLGPVKVGLKRMPFRPSDQMGNILRSRKVADEEAETAMENRLTVGALSDALNERKTASSQADLRQIAAEFNIDVASLTRIARYVNAPTAAPIETRVINDSNDSGVRKLKAIWTDSPIDSFQPSP